LESFNWAFEAFAQGAVFAAFDIETTGLDPKRDRIVEFGAVKFDKRGPASRYSILINPGIPIPEEARRVNNITDKMLAGQPSIEEALPDFLRLIKNTIIIAHNAPFDCGFVNENLARLHAAGKHSAEGQWDLLSGIDDDAAKSWAPPFPALPNKIADTLLMGRRLLPGRAGYKLQDLADFFKIRAEAAHRAMDDARLCMEIFINFSKLVKVPENMV
jgi:DNA polymerase-3 subunit epsilon